MYLDSSVPAICVLLAYLMMIIRGKVSNKEVVKYFYYRCIWMSSGKTEYDWLEKLLSNSLSGSSYNPTPSKIKNLRNNPLVFEVFSDHFCCYYCVVAARFVWNKTVSVQLFFEVSWRSWFPKRCQRKSNTILILNLKISSSIQRSITVKVALSQPIFAGSGNIARKKINVFILYLANDDISHHQLTEVYANKSVEHKRMAQNRQKWLRQLFAIHHDKNYCQSLRKDFWENILTHGKVHSGKDAQLLQQAKIQKCTSSIHVDL